MTSRSAVIPTIVGALLCLVLTAHAELQAWSLKSGSMLVVVGITRGKNSLKEETRRQLEDRRIGFGLVTLLAEKFFDTERFRLFEAQTIRQRQLLNELVTTYWIEPTPRYDEDDLYRVTQQLEIPLLAYGHIAHAQQRKRSFTIGPFSRHTQVLRIRVNVCLYDATRRASLCREGRGMATLEGTGVIYEFDGDRLDFARNAAGKATSEAVTRAVQDLVAAISFQP